MSETLEHTPNEKRIDSDEEVLLIDPQRHLIPATDDELQEIIGSEANYDRWSNFLFPHNKALGLYERRRHEWEVKLPDGNLAQARIEVIPAKDERCYTSRSYDVFLALIVIWKNRGMPDAPMDIYLSDIARTLELKTSGQALKMILDELSCLFHTAISWVFSFETSNEEKETLQNQRILDTFSYVRVSERKGGAGKKSFASVRLSEHIRMNLKNQVTIPVNFQVRKSIKSEVSKSAYSRADNILAYKDVYQRKGENFVKEYGLKESRYVYKSQRKVLLETVQQNLDGKETSRKGVFMRVGVEETKDGLDWKIIFTKEVRSEVKKNKTRQISLPISNNEENHILYLVDEISRVIGGKDKNEGLYRLFAKHYSDNMIFRALGEYKELIAGKRVKEKKAYFTSIMHITAHKMGKEWIKPCGKECRYRPENLLI